ncbi:MAG TPA: DUF4230 domain-containing protein [Gaiellaceae bacterium]|nr:DUF4230 domain-containing protein [Gaiellaceae bacterium]
MGTVAPERTPRPPEQPPAAPPPPPPPERPRRDVPWGLVALAVVVLGVAWAIDRVADVFPDFDNPFATETVDRSGPAVLKSIRDIGEYRAASGDFEVIVDLEQDTGLPDELLGERTLFVAAGSVDAGVDLRGLDEDAVEISDDRRSATITLPPARLFEPVVDAERSYTYERDRGLFNRIGDFFSDDGGSEGELTLLAEQKLREAAQRGAGLVPRAEENTSEMLRSLLGALGFTDVDVRFEDE